MPWARSSRWRSRSSGIGSRTASIRTAVRSWPIAAAARSPRPITSPMTKRDPAAGQRDHVEPVAADTQVPAAGEVALRGVDAGDPRLGARQQGALQGDGGGARLVVQPDVVQRQRRPGRDLLGEGHVVAGYVGPPGSRASPTTPSTRPRARSGTNSWLRPTASALSPRAVPVRSALAAGPPGWVGHPLVGAQHRFLVVPVDSGDPEQDRAVRPPHRARGGTGSRPGRRARRRPGPGRRCARHRGRPPAGRGCRRGASWPRRAAGAGPRATRSTSSRCRRHRAGPSVCPGSGHPGILRTQTLRRESSVGRRWCG